MTVCQTLGVILESKVVQKFLINNGLLNWYSWIKNVFEKIRLIFTSKIDFESMYDFGPFWRTVITRRNFLKIFPWWNVDSWPKKLAFYIYLGPPTIFEIPQPNWYYSVHVVNIKLGSLNDWKALGWIE